jgi:hypothetical protein
MGKKARMSRGFSLIERLRAMGQYPNGGYSRKSSPLSLGIRKLEVAAISRAIPATLGESRPESSMFQMETICRVRAKMRRPNHAREDLFPASSEKGCWTEETSLW